MQTAAAISPSAATTQLAAQPTTGPVCFTDLDRDASAALRSHGRTLTFARGQEVPVSAQGVAIVWFVLAGSARVVIDGEDDKQLLLGISGVGEVLADASTVSTYGETTRMRVIAEEQVQLLGVTDADACRLAERFPMIGRMLLDAARSQARRSQHLTHAISYRSVEQRLAGLLLELDAAHGRPTLDGCRALGLALTQADIAAMIGVSRKAVVGALGALRDRRIVSYRRNRLVLLDAAELAVIARPSRGAAGVA